MKIIKMLCLAVSVFLGGFLGYSHALSNDPGYDVGSLRWFSAGTYSHRIFTDSSLNNYLRVYAVNSSSYAVVVATNANVGIGKEDPLATLDIGDRGGLGLPFITTAEMNVTTPRKAGILAWNSDMGRVCVSSGTGLGAFTVLSSSSGVIPCR